MAATIHRYNFAKSLDGSYAPIDDSGRMPLAWLIGTCYGVDEGIIFNHVI